MMFDSLLQIWKRILNIWATLIVSDWCLNRNLNCNVSLKSSARKLIGCVHTFNARKRFSPNTNFYMYIFLLKIVVFYSIHSCLQPRQGYPVFPGIYSDKLFHRKGNVFRSLRYACKLHLQQKTLKFKLAHTV